MNNPNPYYPQAPPALPPGVDVKISYAVRTGFCLVIGGIFSVFALILFVSILLQGPIEPTYLSSPCKTLSDEAACRDGAVSGGLKLAWTVKVPGTYRLTLRSNPTRALELDTGAGKKLGRDAGNDGPDATVEAVVSEGEYTIQVTDPPSVPANANKSIKLIIERLAFKGADPPSPFAKCAPALLPLVMGLLFLGIPLLFLEEKKYIPVRIDASGVTMRNGARLPWNEFQGTGVINEARRGRTTEVATTLNFARGRAVIRYRPLTNANEVMSIVMALKQGRNPWA